MVQQSIGKLIEALKDQEAIFGPLLFENRRLEKIDLDILTYVAEYQTGEGEGRMESEFSKDGFNHSKNLSELRDFMLECHKCPLEKTRTNLVFGSGDPKAKVMVIGEAPGAEEDLQGKPFVGRAGKLLTDILAAIKFSRDEVYITNILKCRPPGNRNPLPSEMEVCIPYLHRQIEMIKPKLILCLGLISASGLLNLKLSLGKMRGNVYELGGGKSNGHISSCSAPEESAVEAGCMGGCSEIQKTLRRDGGVKIII